MNTKTNRSMPGFTAEASLYAPDEQYQNGGLYQPSGPAIRPADKIDDFAACVYACGQRGGRNCPRQCAYLLD